MAAELNQAARTQLAGEYREGLIHSCSRELGFRDPRQHSVLLGRDGLLRGRAAWRMASDARPLMERDQDICRRLRGEFCSHFLLDEGAGLDSHGAGVAAGEEKKRDECQGSTECDWASLGEKLHWRESS